MDQIRIRGLECYARHGVYEEEKKLGQRFLVDAVLYTDTRQAGLTDRLEASTDYGSVSLFIIKELTEKRFDLIEAAAEHTVQQLLLNYPLVERAELELHKPQAPIPCSFQDVSVRIERGWHTAYVALGSNMGDREALLRQGLDGLNSHPLCRVTKTSSFYITEPYGGVEQEDFLNAVCQVRTLLRPLELLELMQKLEREAGRERKIHWGPRTLDLDLLFYDKEVLDTDRLTVPHPDMVNRDFVLVPLAQIEPGLRHPLTGRTVEEMKRQLTADGSKNHMKIV